MGLFAAIVAQVDGARHSRQKRIILLDGTAIPGDPFKMAQPECRSLGDAASTDRTCEIGIVRQIEVETAARLISRAALNAAIWVAASDVQEETLPKAVNAFS